MPPPPGGGSTTISSPAEGDHLPTTFIVVGTYDGVTLPTISYYHDSALGADVTGTATPVSGISNVWKYQFTDVPESAGNQGKVTADTVESAKLTVTNKPLLTVITPQPGDTISSNFPVIGVYDQTAGINVDTDLMYAPGNATFSHESPAYQSPNAKMYAALFYQTNAGSHNTLVVTLKDDNSNVVATVNVGEINIS